MDVWSFVVGGLLGTFVGMLVGYAAACLAILRKASVSEWEQEKSLKGGDHDDTDQ